MSHVSKFDAQSIERRPEHYNNRLEQLRQQSTQLRGDVGRVITECIANK